MCDVKLDHREIEDQNFWENVKYVDRPKKFRTCATAQFAVLVSHS